MKKLFALLLAAFLLAGMLTACGGSKATDSYNGGVAMDMEAPETGAVDKGIYESVADSSTATEQLTDQKLIKTVEIRAETEDMDALLSQLAEQIRSLGGYTEYQNIYNGGYNYYRSRSAELTIRIPAEKLDSFLNHVADCSNVISKTESVDDITLQYVDTTSRMEALQAEHDRLVELMAKAENLADLLTIEERLTEVRYQLERITSSLRVMDNQVAYATIELHIEEVEVYTEVEDPSVWQRVATGFTDNLKDLGDALVDLFVWVVTYSPQLLIFAGVIVLIVWLCKRALGRRKPPKSPYAPPQPPEEKT